MMKRIAQKGFTLIELLVVIAIIGILAGVVLTSLGTARSSATDSKVKSQLASIRAEAEIIATGASGSYATICSNTQILNLRDLTSATNTVTNGCNSSASVWAIHMALTDSTRSWCVDSTGASRQIVRPTVTTLTACPAAAN